MTLIFFFNELINKHEATDNIVIREDSNVSKLNYARFIFK